MGFAMAANVSSEICITLDYWPETDAEFDVLVRFLRLEFAVQARRRLSGESGIGGPFHPLRSLYIHDLGRRGPRTRERPEPQGRDPILEALDQLATEVRFHAIKCAATPPLKPVPPEFAEPLQPQTPD